MEKVCLSLAVRENEKQTKQFTLDAPTGRHDGREKSLRAVRTAGPAIVFPVLVNLFVCLVVQEDGGGGVRMAQSAIASKVLHHITMKFMYDGYVHNHVLLPGEVDILDEEVGATFPIADCDIFDLRPISRALTDSLKRLQHNAAVLLGSVNAP